MNPRFSYRFHIFFNRNKKIVSLKQPPPSLVRQTEISSRSSISSDITIITRVCLPLFAAKKQKRCKIYLIQFDGVHVPSQTLRGSTITSTFQMHCHSIFRNLAIHPGNPAILFSLEYKSQDSYSRLIKFSPKVFYSNLVFV